MPTVRIYVDPARADAAAVENALDRLHPAITEAMRTRPEVVHLAIVPMTSQPDADPVHVHIEYLPTPERTEEMIAGALDAIGRAVGAVSGTPVRLRGWPAHGVSMARVAGAAVGAGG